MNAQGAAKEGRQLERQRRIIDRLTECPDWDSEDTRPEDVKLFETHGAFVLVGNRHALKIKKAVQFDYMDYGSLESRHRCCRRERMLNRRTAAGLYLEIAPIYENAAGGINLGAGENSPGPDVIEWALKMRAFDAHSRFDKLAAQGELKDPMLDELTDIIVDFHAGLAPIRNRDMMALYQRTIAQNFDQLDSFVPAIFDSAEITAFRQELLRQLDRHNALIIRRAQNGYVRFTHGDLHLQNICLLDGHPTLYDGVEYCDDFAISDILYDLAFLLMDLKASLSSEAANRVLNRYFMQSGALTHPSQFEALALLPFFLAIRAGIRTHVHSSRFLERTHEADDGDNFRTAARRYYRQAMAYLAPPPPRLIAVGGFSGSGKSTLSKMLAPLIGDGVGALHIRSDIVRRKLMDWDEFSPMPKDAYSAEKSEQVYERMRQIAKTALEAGHCVVLDAVFDRQMDRIPLDAIARNAGAAFDGLWLEAAPNILKSRISARTRDASDATVDVLVAQLDRAAKRNEENRWRRLDANLSPAEIMVQAKSALT